MAEAIEKRLATFAHDAIEALDDGRVRVHFKAPSRRGAGFSSLCGLAHQRRRG